mgnify:CR=1 FL=1
MDWVATELRQVGRVSAVDKCNPMARAPSDVAFDGGICNGFLPVSEEDCLESFVIVRDPGA